jgi:hypothetical protein
VETRCSSVGSGVTNTLARRGIEILDHCVTPPPANPLVVPWDSIRASLSLAIGKVLAALDDAACSTICAAQNAVRELLAVVADRNANESGKVADYCSRVQGAGGQRYLLGMALWDALPRENTLAPRPCGKNFQVWC